MRYSSSRSKQHSSSPRGGRMPRCCHLAAPIVAALLLSSCAASIKRIPADPSVRLRDYNRIVVRLMDSSGNVTGVTTTVGDLSSTQVSTGEQQALRALESLEFALMEIGFDLTADGSQAQAVVDFSIGSIRYDALAGWIADQAFLKFRDANSGKVLVYF